MVVFKRFRALFVLRVVGAQFELGSLAFLCRFALESHCVSRLERCVSHRLVPFAKNVFLPCRVSALADARE